MRPRRCIKGITLCVFCFIFCLISAHCGGGAGNNLSSTQSTSVTITSVTVSCAAATVVVGGTDQCSAKVNGTGQFNSGITWSIGAVQGGSASLGTISSSGLYTAPVTVPTPASFTVTATSTGDTTKFASSSVTVTLSLSVSPATATVQLFHPQQFTANVQGVTNIGVNWEVNGNIGGNSTSGTVTPTGVYTPPVVIPSAGTISVTAVSQADPTQSASANVTLVKDTTPPSVLSTSPAAGATTVSVQSSVVHPPKLDSWGRV